MNDKIGTSYRNKAVELALRKSYVAPQVDIYEKNGELTLVADMPGVSTETLAIDVHQGVLSLEGATQIDRRGTCLFSEAAPAGYYRQFKLPEQLDVGMIDAQLENGVLTLRMPKTAAALPQRIQVKTVH